MTATAERLLGELLDTHCTGCGEALPAPGEPCTACGAVPGVTRAEATERLARPGAVAMIDASRLRREAQQGLARVRGLLAEADMTEHAAALECRRDEIATALAAARELAEQRTRDLAEARDREAAAVQAEEDSRARYGRLTDALEAAQRTRADFNTRTEARMRLNAAGPELEADQALLREAVTARDTAHQALAAAQAALRGVEAELAAAQAAVYTPGWAPKSVVTLGLDLVHQAQLPDLTEDEQTVVRAYGTALAAMTGAGEDIAARAIELHDKGEGNRVPQPGYLHPPDRPREPGSHSQPHDGGSPQAMSARRHGVNVPRSCHPCEVPGSAGIQGRSSSSAGLRRDRRQPRGVSVWQSRLTSCLAC